MDKENIDIDSSLLPIPEWLDLDSIDIITPGITLEDTEITLEDTDIPILDLDPFPEGVENMRVVHMQDLRNRDLVKFDIGNDLLQIDNTEFRLSTILRDSNNKPAVILLYTILEEWNKKNISDYLERFNYNKKVKFNWRWIVKDLKNAFIRLKKFCKDYWLKVNKNFDITLI